MACKPMAVQTIAETSELVRLREISFVELKGECRGRVARLNTAVNAFTLSVAHAAILPDAITGAGRKYRKGVLGNRGGLVAATGPA